MLAQRVKYWEMPYLAGRAGRRNKRDRTTEDYVTYLERELEECRRKLRQSGI